MCNVRPFNQLVPRLPQATLDRGDAFAPYLNKASRHLARPSQELPQPYRLAISYSPSNRARLCNFFALQEPSGAITLLGLRRQDRSLRRPAAPTA